MGRLNVSLDINHDVNLFDFVFGKMKVLGLPLSRKRDFGLYAHKFDKWEGKLVPYFKTWFVNLFSVVFGKMKVLESMLSRNCDFSLYAYKFDKWEGKLVP